MCVIDSLFQDTVAWWHLWIYPSWFQAVCGHIFIILVRCLQLHWIYSLFILFCFHILNSSLGFSQKHAPESAKLLLAFSLLVRLIPDKVFCLSISFRQMYFHSMCQGICSSPFQVSHWILLEHLFYYVSILIFYGWFLSPLIYLNIYLLYKISKVCDASFLFKDVPSN